jgi:hypothetical protein
VLLDHLRVQPQPPLQVQLNKRSNCVEPAKGLTPRIGKPDSVHMVNVWFDEIWIVAYDHLRVQPQAPPHVQLSKSLVCIEPATRQVCIGFVVELQLRFSSVQKYIEFSSNVQVRWSLQVQLSNRMACVEPGQGYMRHVVKQQQETKVSMLFTSRISSSLISAGPGEMYYKRSMQTIPQNHTHFSRLAAISCQSSISCSS